MIQNFEELTEKKKIIPGNRFQRFTLRRKWNLFYTISERKM